MAGPGRDALLARWLELTRHTLPGLAHARGWPIGTDHCFMRVCLDAAFGRPWDEVVPRPAIQNLASDDLARAVAVAEALVDGRARLEPLNRRSIEDRRRRAAR